MLAERKNRDENTTCEGWTTRRDFCKGVVGMGVAGGTMLSLLTGCDAPLANEVRPIAASNAGPITIIWETEHDDIGTYSSLANTFNMINKHGISVRIQDKSSDQQHDDLVTTLKARQSSPDIISMDVIWTEEFARNGWVIPLDALWPLNKRQGYLSTPLAGSSYQGKLWAAPFRTDVGLLYYRTDLFQTPPMTWDELIRVDADMKSKTRYGYVWQGKHYEGLVCNFVEVLSSCGGSILDPHNPRRVTVNSAAARQALLTMQSLKAISPPDILSEDEGKSAALWNSGDAAFMRNWPTYIALTYNSAKPEVSLNFDVTSLPSAIPGGMTRSCIGGWGLGINAFSKQKDAAWEFIQWMLQEDAQKFAAIDASFSVTLKSVYEDQSVLGQNPLYSKLPSIIEQAQFRPQSPNYPLITLAIQDIVSNFLNGQASIESALVNLQSKLEGLV